ncbi:MAG: prephenate dehydrogenase/arogenate dehydrogenase family protein, partial [Actinomycetota bacterium]|nr:prephenate dehydrogenase/arogenate dehydrogenase family protein [Actinomycetota bacterium]
MIRRIAVIGLGLIGGSVALATRAGEPGIEIVGSDPDPDAGRVALDRGAIDRHVPDVVEAVRGAELIVLAAPVDVIPDICTALAGTVDHDAIVTDVGSAKRDVVAAGETAFGPAFIGGHPMAGSERHGIAAADDALFTDALWVLTPTELTASRSYQRAAELANTVGARAIAVEPDAHDAL